MSKFVKNPNKFVIHLYVFILNILMRTISQPSNLIFYVSRLFSVQISRDADFYSLLIAKNAYYYQVRKPCTTCDKIPKKF